MNGHRQILQARKHGMKPSTVFIDLDLPWPKLSRFDDPEKALSMDILPTVHVTSAELSQRPDFRFLTGCRVQVKGPEMGDTLLSLADAVTRHSAEVVVYAYDTREIMQFKGGQWIVSAPQS